MKLRIRFSKHGTIKFIGHLDMMRYFQKAIRRSGIPICYSTGFSPHQIMSFAQPLSVGVESEGEYFDIEVSELTSVADFRNKLDAEMVEGVKVLSVVLLPEKAENAMASVKAASYTVRFREGYEPSFSLTEAVSAFHAASTVPYEKETKKGSRTLELKDSVYELSATETTVTMMVDASSGGNIKPGAVMNALAGLMSADELLPIALLITRLDTFTTGDDGKYINLESVGTLS